jgi:lipid-binding SYLF domain-containing protein
MSSCFCLSVPKKGLNAVLDNQFSLGPKAGITFAIYGVDAQAATTAALGAYIVAFASSRGLFGGIATQLSILSQQTGSNQSYYGQRFAAVRSSRRCRGPIQGLTHCGNCWLDMGRSGSRQSCGD